LQPRSKVRSVKLHRKKRSEEDGRFIHLALAASEEAMKDVGLQITGDFGERVGVHIGSGIGGFDVIEREHAALLAGGPRKISPFLYSASIVNLAAGHVSMRFGAKGPNEATATACTTSAHSIGDAYKIIQRNDADAMIAGGSEAAITPMGVGGFAAMPCASTRNDEPERASRLGIRTATDLLLAKAPAFLFWKSWKWRRRGGPRFMRKSSAMECQAMPTTLLLRHRITKAGGA